MRSSLVCLGVVFAITGCAYRHAEHVLTGNVASTHTSQVILVAHGQPRPSQFEEIAIVYAVGHHLSAASVSKLIADQARAVGANVIIDVRIVRGADYAGATGVAVRVSPPEPAEAATPITFHD